MGSAASHRAAKAFEAWQPGSLGSYSPDLEGCQVRSHAPRPPFPMQCQVGRPSVNLEASRGPHPLHPLRQKAPSPSANHLSRAWGLTCWVCPNLGILDILVSDAPTTRPVCLFTGRMGRAPELPRVPPPHGALPRRV